MSMTTTGNDLSVREEYTGEIQPTSAEARAQYEIQSAFVMARRFPRDEDQAYGAIIKACQRTSFAAEVTYSFPRGGQEVKGPSVYFAREFARIWGNIIHGYHVLQDDEDKRTIRCFAWDLQTNTKSECDASFAKLVQRKRSGKTEWVVPDERDLRELTGKHAAIGKRNCLLELLPSDMVTDALAEAEKTLTHKAQQDPDSARKAMVKAFGGIGVTADELGRYLNHPLASCSPDEISRLRQVYQSIKEGHTTWLEHAGKKPQEGEQPAPQPEKPKTNGPATKLPDKKPAKPKQEAKPTDYLDPDTDAMQPSPEAQPVEPPKQIDSASTGQKKEIAAEITRLVLSVVDVDGLVSKHSGGKAQRVEQLTWVQAEALLEELKARK